MSAAFDLVTIDTPRPDRLAAFWAEALRLCEVEREDGDRWIVLAEPDGTRRLGFQRGEHHVGGFHLDLRCLRGELDDETLRLVELGARVVAGPRNEPWGAIVNLRDPDDNPFDLCSY